MLWDFGLTTHGLAQAFYESEEPDEADGEIKAADVRHHRLQVMRAGMGLAYQHCREFVQKGEYSV